jgi:hypothetical protein
MREHTIGPGVGDRQGAAAAVAGAVDATPAALKTSLPNATGCHPAKVSASR